MLVGIVSRCLLLLFVVVWVVGVFGGGMNENEVFPSFCPILGRSESGEKEILFLVALVLKRSREIV